MTSLTLRPETNNDRPMVATMLARTYGSDGVKAIELAGELRRQPDYNPKFAMIIEREGTPLATAMLFPITIQEEKDTLVLASLAFDTKQQDLEPVEILSNVLASLENSAVKYILMRGNEADFADQGFAKATSLTFTNSKENDWLVKPLHGATVANGNVTLPNVLLKA